MYIYIFLVKILTCPPPKTLVSLHKPLRYKEIGLKILEKYISLNTASQTSWKNLHLFISHIRKLLCLQENKNKNLVYKNVICVSVFLSIWKTDQYVSVCGPCVILALATSMTTKQASAPYVTSNRHMEKQCCLNCVCFGW